MASLKFDIWLANATQKRPRAANDLLCHFGSSEKVFFAEKDELAALPFIRKTDLPELCVKNLTASRRILKACEEKNIKIITVNDAVYPFRLKNIYDAPIVLYVSGKMPDFDEEAAIALIGTRRSTSYGRTAARRVGREIAEGGGLVVTGLARGIDSEAAWGAIEGGGIVAGVLGCGIDVVYPPENEKLFKEVIKNGALISEYAPGTTPDACHFPARNRIMSGLSLAVAVIEAPAKSGALITVDHAISQGKDVFVLPGNVDSPACEGSNQLLMEGAAPFRTGRDILSNYDVLYPDKLLDLPNKKNETLSKCEAAPEEIKIEDPIQRKVYELLWDSALRPDEIIEKSGLDTSEVMQAITILQITGLIMESDGDTLKRV